MTEIDVEEAAPGSAIEQALALIDNQLLVMHAREIIPASDVSDLLLDLRLLLTPAPEPLSA